MTTSEPVVVGALLRDAVERLTAAGSASPRLDAELLLGFAIGVDRTAIIAHPDAPVGADARAAFARSVERRAAGEPVAYIRGIKEFRGLAFSVDARALVPRPETERLVELAETEVMRRLAAGARPVGSPPIRIADVGTGSGVIAISLLVALRARRADGEVAVLATDRSGEALDLAKETAVAHAVADRMTFAEVDLLPGDPGAPGELDAPFDVILANLPYIRSSVIADLPVDTTFEPAMALDGGADGLDVIRALLDRLPVALSGDGVAFLEIGADQGGSIAEAVAAHLPGWRCAVEADLAGLPRVARVERAASGAVS